MSNLSLLDTMAQQADARCAQHAAEADAEAAKILEHAREKAAEHREAVWRTARAEEKHKDRVAKQFAQVEADKARLATRNWAVGEVMALVEERIENLVKGPEFRGILEKLLAEALAASKGPVVVEVPEGHVDACREAASRSGAEVRDVVASTRLRDGVAVWNPERSVRIANTLTDRLAILDDDVRKHVVHRLFAPTE